ncbi:hypothetical protein Tco_1070380 [Tanacetum coccineum]|uniref:Uncharacterized protein n=1 Tax=Tanacetum coccineum TaxID=301880 RepID=A0ABQ5HLC4_9ASTR
MANLIVKKRVLYEKTMQKKEGMANLIAGDGVISKVASEIGNTVAGDSHDNDNITKVQSSTNEMCETIIRKTKHASEMFEKTKTEHEMLCAENDSLKKEIEEYKERVRDFNERQYIEKLEQENHALQDQVLKAKSECLIITQHKDKYVNNILQLEAKIKDLENTVCKMGNLSQTLRLLTNKQSLYRENKQKMGLEYTDPCPLGQAIACIPKFYDAEVLSYLCVKPDVHDSEEILNDAEEKDIFALQKNIDKTLLEDTNRRWIFDSQNSLREFYKTDVIPMSKNLLQSSKALQQELVEEVQEMLNILESMERKVDRTSKKNEILKKKIDQLLEANITNDVKNLVMESYVKIKNKEEIERISKESKDGDKFCNDDVEVKEKLSKRIVQLEKDCDTLKAQRIAFEIALQHKTQENKSFQTLQKEKIKENLKSTLSELALNHILGKDDSSSSSIAESNISELEKESGENICENAKCDLQTKIVELEKVLTQQTKDFDDVKLVLSNRTDKFDAYFEKLENTKVVLE